MYIVNSVLPGQQIDKLHNEFLRHSREFLNNVGGKEASYTGWLLGSILLHFLFIFESGTVAFYLKVG